MTDQTGQFETEQNAVPESGTSQFSTEATTSSSDGLVGGSSVMSGDDASEQSQDQSKDLKGTVQIPNVSLLTQGDVGIVEIPGLNIEFDANGLNILKSSGDLVKLLPWDSLLDIVVEDYRYSPVDPVASSMVVATARRSHQFRLRGQDAKTLAAKLSSVSKEYAGGQGLVDSHNKTLSDSLPYLTFIAVVLVAIGLIMLHASGHLAI
jgi:hypothetical protein